MVRDEPGDESITDGEEFASALAGLVEKAVEAGVDVRGAWEVQTRGPTNEWEVEVVELARDLGAEDD